MGNTGMEPKSTARHEKQNEVMKCHRSPMQPARCYAFLSKSIWALPATESSQEMQILVFIIARFAKLQDCIMGVGHHFCACEKGCVKNIQYTGGEL